MGIYDKASIATMENRYRARFINSLAGFKPANLIGTRSDAGQDNLAIVSSVVHLGASPALMAFVSRPDPVPRDTLDNIRANGSFTINHVHGEITSSAHQTAARYTPDASEFAATGLTPLSLGEIYAPFVAESKLRIGLQLREIIPIKHNGTYFIIGEIALIDIPSGAVGSDGLVDIEALGSIAVSGLDRYHTTSTLMRLSYPKPDCEPQIIA